MISCAETTLPVSRVRSDAFNMYLFKRARFGRRLMGTVSTSAGFGFFRLRPFERAFVGNGALGAGAIAIRAAVDRIPAGWLAASVIRAANSSASRFFFIVSLCGCVMPRWYAVTILKQRNSAISSLYKIAIARYFAIRLLQNYSASIV